MRTIFDNTYVSSLSSGRKADRQFAAEKANGCRVSDCCCALSYDANGSQHSGRQREALNLPPSTDR
jgi:hypothetical protein